jgi:hypothetical protein
MDLDGRGRYFGVYDLDCQARGTQERNSFAHPFFRDLNFEELSFEELSF